MKKQIKKALHVIRSIPIMAFKPKAKDKGSVMECALQCAHALDDAGLKGINLYHIRIIKQYLEDWHRHQQ